MAPRVGIELSPTACRIVVIDPKGTRRAESAVTLVTSFASLPPAGAEATAALESLRGRRVAVILWGVPTDHRQVAVDHGSPDRMRAQARAVLRDTGGLTRGTLADIFPMSPRLPGTRRRGVLLATASAREVDAALRPLADAGIKVGAVLTPAAALLSLARTRRSLASPDDLEMYVALQESAACAALVRGGKLLAARDLPWGYLSELAGHQALRARDDIAARLGEDLWALVRAARLDGAPLAQVCICGGLPDLRSMTIPLMQRLDVEVETLDSLFGIDEARLPSPADEFRERAAELRLAWAAAADPQPPIDLFRGRRRRRARVVLARAVVVGGLGAGLGVGWIVQSRWPAIATTRAAPPSLSQAEPRREPVRLAPVAQPLSSPLPPTRGPQGNPPARVPGQPTLGATFQASQGRESARRGVTGPIKPLDAVPPGGGRAFAVGGGARPTRPVGAAPLPTPGRGLAGEGRAGPIQPVGNRPPPAQERGRASGGGVAPIQPVGNAPEPGSGRGSANGRGGMPAEAVGRRSDPVGGRGLATGARGRANEPALPFDAVLGTILYAPNRKLAIIDGRIVQEGDDVRGARVVEITPALVLLRDVRGRLRSLSVGGAAR